MFGEENNTSKPSTSAETSEVELKFEMTDEIKNAKFGSGLIQINNEVFRLGGYITVGDFVEKYKDKYDIFYNNQPYEECDEYLLQSVHQGSDKYTLTIIAKDGVGDTSKKMNFLIQNWTSAEDEKIPLAEGGEVNSFERKPVYEYRAVFYDDTDKLAYVAISHIDNYLE